MFEDIGVAVPDVEYLPKTAGKLRDRRDVWDKKEEEAEEDPNVVIQAARSIAAASLVGLLWMKYGAAEGLGPTIKTVLLLVQKA